MAVILIQGRFDSVFTFICIKGQISSQVVTVRVLERYHPSPAQGNQIIDNRRWPPIDFNIAGE